jgi:Putative MetA-pathway of phenol degradation
MAAAGDLPRVAGLRVRFLLLLTSCVSPLRAQIQDNSFLVEEAYNQERGVVQHISAFQRANSGNWAYGFTQEWPIGGIRHQLSYTIPVENGEGAGAGLGDVALNYRYQLLGGPSARLIAAPRVSILLPTGDEEKGRGQGALGFQVNLPVTWVLSREIVTHWNAGATVWRSTTHSLNFGASAIWLAGPSVNVLVETVADVSKLVSIDGRTVNETGWILNPGVRGALDAGDLQIVPGIAYTIGLGEGSDEDGIFLYLSFEHPFQGQ